MLDKFDFKNAYDKMDTGEGLMMPMYATIYIRDQILTSVYNPTDGLEKGTIFPELYSPYPNHHMNF